MGLDMYLEKEYYVGGHYNHVQAEGVLNITFNAFGGDKKTTLKLDATQIGSVTSQAGYWRKANQVHNFFVEKVQNGRDECQRSYVERKVLIELKGICQQILAARAEYGMNSDECQGLAADLLPPSKGFFFGSQGIDEYYFQDLEDTLEIINNIDLDDHTFEIYYQASW